MPTAVTELLLETDPPRKHWSRAEYEALAAAALKQERLELVGGELISKMGKKRPHVIALVLLQTWLIEVFGSGCVNPEAPIDVAPEDNPASEPEPDLIVLARDQSQFTHSNPGPADLLLVVEVADTTLGFDLTAKARLYARASIVEYWVLDVSGRRLIVHRDPRDGKYTSVAAYREHESIAPLAAPESELQVCAALPAL